MQIGIYGSGTTDSAEKTIKKILDDAEIESFVITAKSKTKQAAEKVEEGAKKVKESVKK